MSTIEGEILGPEARVDDAQEQKVRAGFWRTLTRAASQIQFAEDVVAGYYCALDPKTPARARAILFGALAYFVLPADAVPDFLAFIGFSDDLAVLTMAIATVRGHMTEAHKAAARKALAQMRGEGTGRPGTSGPD
ncbi:uncharacterized membrane protein YkvA (DUF1232 family) [Hoeflea marina]|uniref:Uncharacterized membrane protein YkvA (DUF1232 family) n=1 Tax=Hoeflea marina TaxID=274592 RepID=A0A317PKL2_9HYPH|nr:YkvA family protein [Hoeflea marina]PWV98277.1 uncharacterized membrane protein YkvA (DUF1232 family) [Hoeflea marina]